MKFGMGLNLQGRNADPELLARLAVYANDAELDAIWVGDHIVFPSSLEHEEYPYTESSTYFQRTDDGSLESITAMSYLAALAPKPKLGFSVLVVPYRNPVVAAKMLTTLDVISKGRVILGIGSGWLKGEFEALDQDFDNRGAITDEYIDAMRVLFKEESATFRGERYAFDRLAFYPKPTLPQGPPIWVGGNGRVAIRRAARIGDNWHPLGLTPDEITRKRVRLRRECESIGRDAREVDVSLRIWFHFGEEAPRGLPVGHASLLGSPSQMRETVLKYEDVGVSHLLFKPLALSSNREFEEQIHRFVEDVVAYFH